MNPRQPLPVARRGEGGNSIRLQRQWPGRCGEGSPVSRQRHLRRTPGRRIHHMPADALKCKECSDRPTRSRRASSVSAASARSRWLLAARRRAREALKRRIQAGPHTIWRYADFLPLEGPARSALPTGWTPLVKADRLAERLGLGELWIKNETANPTHSFKDRVVSVALARAQELGFDTHRLRLDRQPRQRGRRARRGRRAARLRADPGRPRGAEDPRHRRLRRQRSSPSRATTTTSTGSAPRSPASAPTGRS